MDRKNPSVPPGAQVSPARRIVAVGITRHRDGRTLTVRATTAGVTGIITRTAVTR
ncbi:hypothetical protein [Streptomyces sp. NRRL F-5630]|uniref:hypothetical protein n=1 Tax=Streptomyces sp. NRRL F-5630 TaxID=1463864 RepID=UPI003D71E9DB